MSVRARIENEQRKEVVPDTTRHEIAGTVEGLGHNTSCRHVHDKRVDKQREENSPAGRRRKKLADDAESWLRYEKSRKIREEVEQELKQRRAEERELTRQKLTAQLKVVYDALGCTNEEVCECIRRLDNRGIALTSRALYDEVKALRKERGR